MLFPPPRSLREWTAGASIPSRAFAVCSRRAGWRSATSRRVIARDDHMADAR